MSKFELNFQIFLSSLIDTYRKKTKKIENALCL